MARRQEREWLSYIRDIYRLLPGYRSTRRHASAIVIGSGSTFSQMPRCYRGKCIYIPENAVDPDRFGSRRQHRARVPLKLIFVGRLVPYKGADMLIEAAASLVRERLLSVEIIGEGPQRPELDDLIARERLQENIRLSGWIEHRAIQQRLAIADLFVFPSIREFGGAVALEAMAVGVVPVVVNYGGLSELVTPETGFKVEIGTRDKIISEMQLLFNRLVRHPEEIDARSLAAMQRVRELFTWDVKARHMVKVYDWVLRGRQEARPEVPRYFNDCPAVGGNNNKLDLEVGPC